MRQSTEKLVAALGELNHTRDDRALEEIIEAARRDEFHDFQSPHTFPLLELMERLRNLGYSEDDPIIKRIKDGEFDATKDESAAWMRSPEGQDALAELTRSSSATPPSPPPDEGLWVRSELTADGTYGIGISVDAARAWSLDRDQAAAYALACFHRATEAEHHTAVFRLLTGRLGIAAQEASGLLVRDLRPDRPEAHQATAPLRFTIAIGRARHPRPDAGAYLPLLMMELDGKQTGQLSPADLRDHAAAVLDTIAATELDTALHRVLIGKAGLDDPTARAVVASLGEYWPSREEPRS